MYLLVSGKNGTSNNGTGNNGTSGKVGKNGTFSILGFGVGVEGLEWGGLGLGFKGSRWGFGKI